jgi:hypothetical protein
MQVGDRVRITLPEHPWVGTVGSLIGFAGAPQLTQGQRSTIAMGDISPSQVNAIVSVGGANLMGSIHSVLTSLASDIIGRPYSAGAIRQLFTHIDRDITLRYIANPKSASGYLSYDAGTWDPTRATGQVRDVWWKEEGLGRGYINDRLGSRKINDKAEPTHGAGAWEDAHKSGIAVHPGDPTFARLTSRGRAVKPIARPGQPNTLYGCNAILKAILAYGPEKSMTAEESYEAERSLFNAEESVNIAGGYNKKTRNPYPQGLHTDEAVYFMHLKSRWVMAGGGKSGRSTEGAKNRYEGYGVQRIGSPVGTSFRFQLSDDPENGGLEYTLALRRELRTVADRVKVALDDVDEVIKSAKSVGVIVDTSTMQEAEKVRKSLNDNILVPIQSAISFISTLGVDVNGKTSNTLDTWKKANDELERSLSHQFSHLVKHEFPEDAREQIKEIKDHLWTIHTIEASEGVRLFGGAPVPTSADVQLGAGGEIIVTLSNPQPVYDPSVRNQWFQLQDSIVSQVASILSQAQLMVKGDPSNPTSVEVMPGGSARISSYFAQARRRLRERVKSAESAHVVAWESDITTHATLGDVLNQDMIDDVLSSSNKKSPDGDGTIVMGFKTGDRTYVSSDSAQFGHIVLVSDSDFKRAEDQFFSELHEFGTKYLAPYMESLVSTLTSIPEDQVDSAAVSKVFRNVRHYEGLVVQGTKGDWRKSVVTHYVDDGKTPDLAARKAADLSFALENGFRDIAQIVDVGHILVRAEATDERTRRRHEELKSVIEDTFNSNERNRLQTMGGFPSDRGLTDILGTLSRLQAATMSSRTDQVCVPLKTSDGKLPIPLLRARIGSKITGDALGVVLSAVEPIK